MIFKHNKFKEKLKNKGYADSTILGYTNRLALYEEWCNQKKNLNNERKLAFLYLKHLQKQTSNYRTINRELQPLKLYYKFFKKTNPFHNLYIKKKEEKIRTNLFTKEELEEIYDEYPQNTIYEIRDKVLLGFYIFQGAKSSEIKNIEINDVDLVGYKILLRGDNRTNQRKIGLNIKQILLLSEYINIHRKKLVGRKKSDDLIFISKSKHSKQNQLQRISEKLRNSVYGFEALYQIRTSVIHNWIKEYDLRKSQYLSGHRYISTTERFIIKDIKGLQKAIDSYFPLD